MSDKFLWKPVTTADQIAETLRLVAGKQPEKLPALIKPAADMLLKQQTQITNIILELLKTSSPQETAELLFRAGFDRNELHFAWGIPKEAAIKAEQETQRKAANSTRKPLT